MKIGDGILLMFLISVCTLGVNADINDEYHKMKENALSEYNKFRNNAIKEYEDFRHKANEDFARCMEQPWNPSELSPTDIPPLIPSPDPIIEDIDTVLTTTPTPIIISEVVPIPAPSPQPEPIEPIREIKEGNSEAFLSVNLYGTDFRIRKPDMSGFKVTGGSKSDIAKAWDWLNSNRTNNLIKDCLSQRDEKALCDWAYLNFLNKVAKLLAGGNKNAETLLTGFLFSQSGYKMRFGCDSRKQLHLFYNPTGIVYRTPYTMIDGEQFYKYDNGIPLNESFEVCKFNFPGEKPLRFEILKPMNLDFTAAPERNVTPYNHPEVKVSVTVNKNLIDFYNSYPEATITDEELTFWTLYGNAPASHEISTHLYPTLHQVVKDKSQKDAANILLHLAQSFEYGYDEDIWGRNRVFFMDESWYYPYSDCEDHAINFGRLIRDIMGLDVALVYYPEHLATAVAFTDSDITGDYFIYNGKKYIVCDPTIFYSNVGRTMQGMNNSEAKLIPLR